MLDCANANFKDVKFEHFKKIVMLKFFSTAKLTLKKFSPKNRLENINFGMY